MRSSLGKLLVIAALHAVILPIAYFTAPTEKEMRKEMTDNIMQCIEVNDSIRGDRIDDFVHNIGFIFTKADTTSFSKEWREAFEKYNRLDVYRHTFFTTAYVYNNLRTEGARVGIGFLGIVIPTVSFSDLLLHTGPMHKGYDQRLIRTTVIPDNDLGTNPNVQEFHYRRNPDE